MERIASNLPKMYIIASGIAALSCLARADFNLPLFIFVYLMWQHDPVTPSSLLINPLFHLLIVLYLG